MKRIRIKRRYIVLFISILLPLLAAFLVGSYGYNSEKFGQGDWKKEFATDYFTHKGDKNPTTEETIEKYLEFGINNQYFVYDEKPLYSQEVQDENGAKLFDLLVYRAVYKFRVDDEPVDRLQYIFFYYNVQYQNIRNQFDADENLREEINNTDIPTFISRIVEIVDDEDEEALTRAITQIPEDQLAIRDRGADVTYKSGLKAEDGVEIPKGEVLVKAFMGFVPMREVNVGDKFKVEIEAMIPKITDDTGASIKTTIAELELELEPNPENINYEDFATSYQQDLERAGYFAWVFKKYLWWISLIGFVAVGLITGLFYLVYVGEENRALEEAKRIKKRKR